MGNVPYPLSAADLDELKGQIYELIRRVYEEKIGGADLGDVFSMPGDVLTLVLDTDTPGLQKSDNKLSVKVASDGGVLVAGNGVGIKIVSAGGLETSSTGLGIKLNGTSLGLSASGLKVNNLSQFENVQLDAAGAVYFGDPTTEGSWRTIRVGNNLAFQRYESGDWATKETILA